MAEINIAGELGDIVDQLRAQNIPADLDRDKVNLPGVWVTTNGISFDGLDYYTVHVRLIVMAADRAAATTLTDFDDVVNKLLVLFGNPDDDLTPVTVNRAGAALPGLAVPIDFRAEYIEGDN
jgi:hypothetical protein